MKITEFTCSTNVDGVVKSAEGMVELYESVRDMQDNLTVEHFKLLNAKLLEVAQTALRNTLKDNPEKMMKDYLKELKKSNPEAYRIKMAEIYQALKG